jgi:hypothetical protein
MDDKLTSRMIFHDLMTRFATSADRNEAIKAMALCTEDMTIGPDDDLKPKGALANALMIRTISSHVTKHHVGSPTIESYAAERIVGTVPITSYRLDDDKASFSVSEFWAEIVPDTESDDWRIARLRMIPFATYLKDEA